MLSVGIIGLPNVGKSTLFNALTAGSAVVSNYPFTTIEPNVGMVPVPDERLARLEELLAPEEATPCFVRFVDIAGLVEGASRGEGLGNQFLGEIRGVDAVAHVVRCFETADVAHVYTEIDPWRDARVIEGELSAADLELLSRAIAKRRRDWATHPRDHERERERLERWRSELEAGRPLRRLALDADERREVKALGLLTGRPLLYVANVSEAGYGERPDPIAARLRQALSEAGSPAPVVEVSARLEAELAELAPEERRELAAGLGLAESGLARLVRSSFELLELIRFYTVAHDKLRAWEIARGTRAPQAAGKIHGDMEEGFIRAQVGRYEDLLEHGDFAELHRLGKLHTHGKEYVIADGDVVEFVFRGG